jgi:hypothetical protein
MFSPLFSQSLIRAVRSPSGRATRQHMSVDFEKIMSVLNYSSVISYSLCTYAPPTLSYWAQLYAAFRLPLVPGDRYQGKGPFYTCNMVLGTTFVIQEY